MKGYRLGRMPTAVAAVLVAGVLGLSATACSVPRGGASASTEVAGCAAVLPLAKETVHGNGTLIAIRRVARSDIDAITREVGATPLPPPSSRPPSARPPRPTTGPTTGPRLPRSCLVVYKGTYPPGSIAGASSPATSGHYALIILKVRHPAVSRVLVTDHLPPAAE